MPTGTIGSPINFTDTNSKTSMWHCPHHSNVQILALTELLNVKRAKCTNIKSYISTIISFHSSSSSSIKLFKRTLQGSNCLLELLIQLKDEYSDNVPGLLIRAQFSKHWSVHSHEKHYNTIAHNILCNRQGDCTVISYF